MEKHIAIQNTWFSDANLLAPYDGQNGVISISGHWWLQQGTFGDSSGFRGWRPAVSGLDLRK